jgi:GDP-L-fucose synthase
MWIAKRRILVTGGSGFLGRHTVAALGASGCAHVDVPRSRDYDLTCEAAVERLFRDARPQVVIHLAARVGGIGANRRNPGRFLYDNLMMGALVIEHARRAGVEKLVTVGTVCSYPRVVPLPFREESLWDGYPEPTNAPYGLAKRMLLAQGQAYRRQYGLRSIFLLPTNLYGPGDSLDPESSHVIPALIVKCLDAIERGEPRIVCWGDGGASREFLYVEDCARAIVLATERYDGEEPVNVGAGIEWRIADLARLVAEMTGFRGAIEWDRSMPNGQPRRRLDVSRAAERFGFRAAVDLREGLRRTIDWVGAASARRRGSAAASC